MFTVAQICGFIGMGICFLIYQQKTHKGMVLFKLIGEFFWLIHKICLRAYSGVAISVVAILRSFVFYNNDKKWAQHKWWLYVFLVISVVSSAVTYQNIYSLFAAATGILAVIAFWHTNPKVTKLLTYPISAFSLVYNVVANSYAGIVSDILTLISLTISMIVTYRENKKYGIKGDILSVRKIK